MDFIPGTIVLDISKPFVQNGVVSLLVVLDTKIAGNDTFIKGLYFYYRPANKSLPILHRSTLYQTPIQTLKESALSNELFHIDNSSPFFFHSSYFSPIEDYMQTLTDPFFDALLLPLPEKWWENTSRRATIRDAILARQDLFRAYLANEPMKIMPHLNL